MDVYDAFGEKVASQVFNNKQLTLKRGTLSEGVYFFTIRFAEKQKNKIEDNRISTGKLIISD